MSVTLLLVPLALAGASAVKAAVDGRVGGPVTTCQVQTRMRDRALLAEALKDTGATVAVTGGTLTAAWSQPVTTATFAQNADGIWAAHFAGIEQERAVELVTAVDTAYGRQVQRAVLTRLREQAPAAGLRLESESVEADASVRLMFEVERERA